MAEAPVVEWSEDGEPRSARWQSERGAPPPTKMVIADDRMTADEAYGLAAQGVALLWQGDFQNARQMLTALASRADRKPSKAKAVVDQSPAAAFNLERQARAQRARTLSALLVPIETDYTIPLRRAPDWRKAMTEAYGPGEAASVVALRELLGVNSAHEWRKNGIELPAHGMKIHPHYGVFAPIRSEYVDLVAKAPLPAALKTTPVAFDIGTGTGVLAAVLARRGVPKIIATDVDPRAIACARENMEKLGLTKQVEVVQADMFPEGKAGLIVCNPPWVPARPSSPLEHGIYDPESRMLRGFLDELAAHLTREGEGWLVLSDLAEHLGLRTREELLAIVKDAGLVVFGCLNINPKHPRSMSESDPLHAARKREKTSLWQIRTNHVGVG